MIHVLRISEEAEKPSTDKSNQQKNAKSTVNLAKPLSLHEPKSVAFVEASGCDPHQTSPNKSRPVQLASIKLHQSTELGPDVYLMQGKKGPMFKKKDYESCFEADILVLKEMYTFNLGT